MIPETGPQLTFGYTAFIEGKYYLMGVYFIYHLMGALKTIFEVILINALTNFFSSLPLIKNFASITISY